MAHDSQGLKTPFIVHCGACSHEWTLAYLPLPVEVFTKFSKSPCPMCGSDKVYVGAIPKKVPEGDPIAWLASGDTGISSKAIWTVLMGRVVDKRELWGGGVPHDPDDFGRCYRLLKVMPSWRGRLAEVAAQLPHWKNLVEVWDELTGLYEEELPTGRCPKLYERMKDLRV